MSERQPVFILSFYFILFFYYFFWQKRQQEANRNCDKKNSIPLLESQVLLLADHVAPEARARAAAWAAAAAAAPVAAAWRAHVLSARAN